MLIQNRLLAGIFALSVTVGAASYFPHAANAQGIVDRIEARREAREQAKNSQQATQSSQQSPMSQPAKASAPEVSMVTLHVKPSPKGELVITPKGIPVPLPGAGVNGSVVQIYIGSNGGYWYVDKNKQQVDLTSAVQMMQANAALSQQMPIAQVPQYAPQPIYQTNNYAQSSGVAPGATMAAAELGAMAGSALASPSAWGTVPYGTPIHYNAAALPYYNQGGKAVYVNNSTDATVNSYHAASMNQQQSYYAKEVAAQGTNWRAWQQPITNNPFVSSVYQEPRYGAAAGATAAHYGAVQGQQDARYGAAAGATAAHYGAEQGQQDERYGAAAGASAAHYGAQQGQEDEKKGAAAGASAAHYGANQGEQSAQNGREAGAAAAHRGSDDGRDGFSGRNGQGAGRERGGGRRR